MEVISVKHKTDIIKGEYQFADKVKSEVLSLLKVCNPISQDQSYVCTERNFRFHQRSCPP